MSRFTSKRSPTAKAPSKLDVRTITAAETLDIRHAVLRAGLPRESAIFPGDDAPTTVHFGAFHEGALIGVASIYHAPLPERPDVGGAWQLRGMATIDRMRRCGVGLALLQGCVAAAKARSAELLWCNARTVAVGFYAKHGWRLLGDEFDIPTAGPHRRMWLPLGSGDAA